MLKCIDYLPDEHVVRATITGEMGTADYYTLLVELHAEAGRHGVVRQLIELQGTISQFGQLDLHDLPLINKALPLATQQHTAVVHRQLSANDLDDLNYFCHRINAEGFDVRLFPESKDALSWLCTWDSPENAH